MESEMNRKCVILGGGDILDYGTVFAMIKADDFIICADNGYRHCEKLGLLPSLLVGDFDSIVRLPPDVPRVTVPAEKDFTDTALALSCAVERGYDTFLASGMMGGRRFDHTLGNLQILARHARQGAKCFITDGITDICILHSDSGSIHVVEPKKNHYFSLVSLTTSCENLSIAGAKYELTGYTLRFDETRGLSNEFTGVPVVVSWDSGTMLLVVTPMDLP